MMIVMIMLSLMIGGCQSEQKDTGKAPTECPSKNSRGKLGLPLNQVSLAEGYSCTFAASSFPVEELPATFSAEIFNNNRRYGQLCSPTTPSLLWALHLINGEAADGTFPSASIAAVTSGAPLATPPGTTTSLTAAAVAPPTSTSTTAAPAVGGEADPRETGAGGGTVGTGSGSSNLASRMMGKVIEGRDGRKVRNPNSQNMGFVPK